MTYFMVVPGSHSFIMRHEAVLNQTMYFLKNKKFNYPAVKP